MYLCFIHKNKMFFASQELTFGSPWGEIILIEKLVMQYKGIKIALRKKEFSHLEGKISVCM